MYRLTYHVPGYNLFKAPAKNWLNVHLGISVLCGYGLHTLLILYHRKKTEFRRIVGKCSCLVLFIGAGMVIYIISLHHREINSWAHTSFTNINESIRPYISWRNPAIYIPVITVFINGFLLGLWALTQRKIFLYFISLPLVLMAVSTKQPLSSQRGTMDIYFDQRDKNPVYSLIREREKHIEDYRVFPLNVFFWDQTPETLHPLTNSLYGIRSLSGYGPLFIKDIGALYGMVSVGTINNPDYFIRENRLFSMMNVKYFPILAISCGVC